MDRKNFIKSLTLLSSLPFTMKLNALNNLKYLGFKSSERMPVLFLGHGGPTNAIDDNEFVREFKKLGKDLPIPQAILCISAHWETKGTFVTAMQNPKTIHDFGGGFPQSLFDFQYNAPGSIELANETKKIITSTDIGLSNDWGLDHGAWSVITHLYPNANIPVIQMSLDYTKPAHYHYDLAKQLSDLRDQGILIIGSGNMVHNLGKIAWKRAHEQFGFDWAQEASEKMKKAIKGGDHKTLIDYKNQGKAFDLSIPTPDHYLPLIYAMALKDDKDEISLFNDKYLAGSLTMTSVKITKG